MIMEGKLAYKYQTLKSLLEKTGKMAIAFSGGVDSVFLLDTAKEVLEDKVMALTVRTPFIPEWEIEEARTFAQEKKITHHILDIEVAEQLMNNPEDRCYHCKSLLFNALISFSMKHGFKHIADGSNADDTLEHRPGMKALRELKVMSPLLEAGFTKSDIRTASKEKGLPSWKKPAYACLMTRIPYNTRVDHELLRKIERSENFLMELGIRAVRVRVHENLARIETEPLYIERIFREKLLGRITKQLKRYGFSYVTLDLEGYRTGGIEDVFKEKQHDRTR
jgi:uncharacterized protein